MSRKRRSRGPRKASAPEAAQRRSALRAVLDLFEPHPYRALEKKLNYRFRDRALLAAALTHRSYRFENREVALDNQRLEYLGDAALGLVCAAHLYLRFPDLDEGELTQIRSDFTGARALSVIGREIGLGAHLRLGRGEQMSGGHDRASTLEDALEAVLGAAYLDGGMKAVERIFEAGWADRLRALGGEPTGDNPKGDLQEVCQRRWKASPRYRVIAELGPLHAREYEIECMLGERSLAVGRGPSKKAAEADAATRALASLQSQDSAT